MNKIRLVLILLTVVLVPGLAAPLPLADAAAPGETTATPGVWTHLPGPLYPGGVVDELAISPVDPDLAFALLPGVSGERLFRSTDNTLTWTQVYTFTVPTKSLGLDALDASNLYAGSQDALFHSTDSGLHWTQVYTMGEVTAVVSPTLLIAGGPSAPSDSGCYSGYRSLATSQDGGLNWTKNYTICASELGLIRFLHGEPDVVFVSAFDEDDKLTILLRSLDGGHSWEPLPPHEYSYSRLTGLVIDSLDSNHLYAADEFQIYTSPDQGETWTILYSAPADLNAALLIQSEGRLYAVQKYALGSKLYYSDNAGLTWWVSANSFPRGRMNVLASGPIPGRLYFGLAGYGVYASFDWGSTWQERNDGITTPAPVNSIALSPASPGLIYAGSDGPRGGLYHSSDGGLTWTTVITDTFINSVSVSPEDPDMALAGGSEDIYETVDGEHWQRSYLEISLYQVIQGTSSLPPYAAGSTIGDRFTPPRGLVMWASLPPIIMKWVIRYVPGSTAIYSLAVHPLNPEVIFAAGQNTDKFGAIFRSRDNGATWEEVLTIGGECSRVIMAKSNPGRIYVACSGQVFRSSDGGDSWTFTGNFQPDLPYGYPISALIVDDLGAPWAGATAGIYRWNTGANDWELEGLEDVWTEALTFQSKPQRKVLAGNNLGLWELNLPPLQVIWLPLVGK